MSLLGQRSLLTIVRSAPPGFYLDGGAAGEILLPGKYNPPGANPGDKVDVFVYRDSEDRLVATTEKPLAVVGECAYLRVVGINPRIGLFLDWGLDKERNPEAFTNWRLCLRPCPSSPAKPLFTETASFTSEETSQP